MVYFSSSFAIFVLTHSDLKHPVIVVIFGT